MSDISLLTSALNETDAASYATGSITPSPNGMVVIGIAQRIATGVTGGPKIPAVSGGGCNWIVARTQVSEGATPNRRLSTIISSGMPESGALTIDFGGEVQTHCHHIVAQLLGAAGIKQIDGLTSPTSQTSCSLTLASPVANPVHLTLGFIVVTSGLVSPLTLGAGFTLLRELVENTDGTDFMLEWKRDSRVAGASWGAGNSWIMTVLEVETARNLMGRMMMVNA